MGSGRQVQGLWLWLQLLWPAGGLGREENLVPGTPAPPTPPTPTTLSHFPRVPHGELWGGCPRLPVQLPALPASQPQAPSAQRGPGTPGILGGVWGTGLGPGKVLLLDLYLPPVQTQRDDSQLVCVCVSFIPQIFTQPPLAAYQAQGRGGGLQQELGETRQKVDLTAEASEPKGLLRPLWLLKAGGWDFGVLLP